MASKTSLLCLFAILCILVHETVAQKQYPGCKDPMITEYTLITGKSCPDIKHGYSYHAEANDCRPVKYTDCRDSENLFQTYYECMGMCHIDPPQRQPLLELRQSLNSMLDKVKEAEQLYSRCYLHMDL